MKTLGLVLTLFLALPALAEDAPSGDDESTIESMMLKKIDVVEKAEKIETIEKVVSGQVPADEAKREGDKKSGYRPLRDESPKIIQAIPPFQVQMGQ